jgi:hypothetical protein
METETDENQNQQVERIAGPDLLVGGAAIKAYLVDDLGWPPTTDPYYLKRRGWPIGSTSADGGKLITTRRRIARHTAKLASPAA